MGLGSAMMLSGVLIAGGLAYATAKAAEFNSEIILLHTQARVATSQLPALSAGILSMAGDVGFTSVQLAKALYFIESVGGGSYTTAHALDILKAAAMGAAVGHADLAITASTLASVMAVFPGMLPTQAMGQLDAIIGQGKMTMEDLNSAMQTGILATLQASGVSLADFGGALATMTDYSIPATQAANSLRMALYLMTAPTAASNKVLKEFGLTTAEVSSVSQAWTDKLEKAGIRHAQLADDLRKPGGIILALEDLRSHLVAAGLDASGQAEVIYKAFGGGKMGKAVITLYENLAGGARASDAELRKLGFTTEEIATLHDRLITKTALINAQTNLLGKNFQYIKDNDPVQMWKEFTAGINALVIALGTAFIPVLIAIIHFLTPLIKSATEWITKNQDLVRIIGIVAVVLLVVGGAIFFIIGAIAVMAGAFLAIGAMGLGATILPLIGLLLLIGVVVGVVAFLVIKYWSQIGGFFSALGTKVHATVNQIGGFFSLLGTKSRQTWDGIGSGIKNATGKIGATFSAFGLTVRRIWTQITNTVEAAARSLWQRPWYWATRLVLFLPGLVYQLVPRLIQWGVEVVLNAEAAFGRFFVAIVGWLMRLPGVVESWAVNLVARFTKWSIDTYTAVVSWFQRLPGRIAEFLGAIVARAVEWSNNMINQAKGMAQGFWDSITHFDWAGLGASILRGIIEGMKNLAGWAGQQAANIAGQISQGIKDAFGVSSPSKLMALEVGIPIMQGIWSGVKSEAPKLNTNFRKVASGMTTAGASAGNRSLTSTTNLNSRSDIVLKLDQEVLARAVDKRYQRIANRQLGIA